MRYYQLCERVLNLFDPEQKAQFADQVWDILQKSYAGVGGFKSAANVEELVNQTYLWKCIGRDGHITAVNIYTDKHGRKSIASGTDGSAQGKKDYMKLKDEDLKYSRAWAEVSGPVEKMMVRSGAVPVPNKFAHLLTNKEILDYNNDGVHYTRLIAGEPHEKVIYGFVQLTQDVAQKLETNGITLQDLPSNVTLKK